MILVEMMECFPCVDGKQSSYLDFGGYPPKQVDIDTFMTSTYIIYNIYMYILLFIVECEYPHDAFDHGPTLNGTMEKKNQ